MLCGIIAGLLLRRWKFPWLDRAMICIIWLLLFELGVEVGGDDMVLRALPTLGLSALEIAAVAMLGSCLAAFGLARWVKSRGKSRANAGEAGAASDGGIAAAVSAVGVASDAGADDGQKEHPLKGSLIILAFFIAGCLVGYFKLLDNMAILKDVSFYTLAVLIVMVGLSIGHNKDVLNSLKSQDWRLLLLPLFTILGTLAACTLLSFAMPYSLTECLAIGSGQAYYSLSSIMITQSKGIELGTIALLSNIFRELLTLLSAPLLVRVFGRLAPIAAGGATTADTTLPIIRQVCGSDMAILSVYHGFLVDFSVPFLVTLFCSI